MTDQNSTLLAHLPYLRRYARALTGAQLTGDRLIGQYIKALPAQSAAVREWEGDGRRDLYRGFNEFVSTFGAMPAAEPGDGADPVALRLAELTPERRQLMLLTSVEGFSALDAGVILGLDEATSRRDIEVARASIAAQRSTRALIVEDEPVIALNLSDILRRAGHEVAGVATTKTEAVEMAVACQPGLILCDIQLQDGSSGLEAASEILKVISAAVIFITAFPERLLTGAVHEPTFLITKPFNAETVLVTISQALLTRR